VSEAEASPETLTVFVGHSDDAHEEARAIVQLETELQRQLDIRVEVMADARFRRIKLWEWTYDARPVVGGQERAVTPYLRTAHVAIFVFKTRVGSVTWEELNQCRARKDRCAVIALFPARPPAEDQLLDAEGVAAWGELLAKKRELTSDWAMPDSRSVVPVEPYRDIEHLLKIVREQFARLLSGLLLASDPVARRAKSPPAEVRNDAELRLAYETTARARHPCNGARLDDLDWSLVGDFTTKELPEAPVDQGREDLLAELGLFSPLSASQTLHYAAVLCFCRRPHRIIPEAVSVFLAGQIGEDRLSITDVEGPLSLQVGKLVTLAMGRLGNLSSFDGGLRAEEPEIPLNVVREAISNAIAHRDYHLSGNVQVRITDTHLEVQNPGSFPSDSSWETFLDVRGAVSRPSDMAVAFYLKKLLALEGIGRGFAVFREHIAKFGTDAIVWSSPTPSTVLVRIRRLAPELATKDRSPGVKWDVFVSHASEDKVRFVEPLVAELRARGLAVWDDRHEFRIGDDIRRKLDEGIRGSRVGVVVLSPRTFKYWPEAEWGALFAQGGALAEKNILPIRLDLGQMDLADRAPFMAGRVSASWEEGVGALATKVEAAVRGGSISGERRRSPVYNLPSRQARQIFGRDEDLVDLAGKLQPGRSVRVAATIEGLAGVGKTELALHLVDRLAAEGRFPGGIFWFDAERPDLTATWGGPIADALAVGSAPVAERAAAAVRIVSSGLPALLVLDNVERWTRDSAPGPLPGGAHVALLVTTRHAFLAGRAFEHHSLDVLAPEAAGALLLEVSGRELGEGRDELLEHLGGHALAVELAGAYLHEFKGVSPRQYLERRSAGQDLDDRVVELVRYERTVKECFDATWTTLAPPAARVLAIAAHFANEDASLALLESCHANEESIGHLQRLHLITVSGDRWRMHKLVREYARSSGSGSEREEAQRAFVEGCAAFSQRIDWSVGVRVHAFDLSHLEEALALALADPETAPETRSILMQRLAIARSSTGDFHRAKDLLEAAVASDLKNFGDDHRAVAKGRANLAMVHRELGDLERARELMEAALAADVRDMGEDHPDVAEARSNLAMVLRDLGQVGQARELLEAAVAHGVRNLGEAHPTVAENRSNLAMVLSDAGELESARELMEAALASHLRNMGEDHPAVAKSRSNLAMVLAELGELGPARELMQTALASDLRNLGEDHPTVARRTFNLAHLVESTGDHSAARTLLETALSIEARRLGPDHPSTSYTRVRLAKQLAALGDQGRARSEAERARRAVAAQPPGSQYRVGVEREAKEILGN
jgi:tetratricopeptide (TPR) repeat protein